MTPPSPPPPHAPSPFQPVDWPTPIAPRAPVRYLGVDRRVWLVAWLPLVPTAVFALWVPKFVAPMFDAVVPLVVLVALCLLNLGVARVSRNDTLTGLVIATTTLAGAAIAMFGSAVVLILKNLA